MSVNNIISRDACAIPQYYFEEVLALYKVQGFSESSNSETSSVTANKPDVALPQTLLTDY
jgi:hypothetical protein